MKMIQVILCLALVAILAINVNAQSIQEKLEKFGVEYAKGYTDPLFGAFGASLNSGWYHTANVDDGVSIFVGMKLMYLPIPDDAKKFTIASPYDGIQQEIPTVFGADSEITISRTNIPSTITPSPEKYPKGMNLDFVPLAMPHIAIGNYQGTRLMLRFFPKTKVGDFGDFEMFGIGAQHNIGNYIPAPLPVDLSAMVAYQSLKLGTFFDATSFTFGAQASKTFSFVDLYAGLSYETANMSIGYDATFTDPSNPTETITQHIGFDAEGKNTVRLTGGFALNLYILKITADYSVASQPVATLGIGLGW